MKRFLWILLVVFMLAFQISEANATSLSLSIQHRNYANGSDLYRFALIPSPAGDPLLNLNTVQVFMGEAAFNLNANFTLLSFDTINGRYSYDTKCWTYDNAWGKLDYYYANVASLPNEKNYAVTVSNTYGQMLSAWGGFGTAKNLPIVDVATFSNSFDSSGNFYLNWAIPQNMPGDAYFGVFLDGIIDGKFVSEIAISNPNTINSIMVPSSVLEGLGMIDYISASVLVRTFDGFNRSYSFSQNINLPDPVPEPATMILLGTGLLLLAGYDRKKLKK